MQFTTEFRKISQENSQGHSQDNSQQHSQTKLLKDSQENLPQKNL